KPSAALAVFQVAAAVTFQYYLERVSRQLDNIAGGISSIKERLQSQSYGKLWSAVASLDDLEARWESGVGASDDMTKLALAESQLDEVFGEALKNLKTFNERISGELKDDTEINKDRFRGLLREAADERRFDAAVLCIA